MDQEVAQSADHKNSGKSKRGSKSAAEQGGSGRHSGQNDAFLYTWVGTAAWVPPKGGWKKLNSQELNADGSPRPV